MPIAYRYVEVFAHAGTMPGRITRRFMETVRADKLGPLSDGSPRDASTMGNKSHASLYVVPSANTDRNWDRAVLVRSIVVTGVIGWC